jgi:tRNA U34 5-carboxymethylaminomethyl modifying GTPase MnmE/TrmE
VERLLGLVLIDLSDADAAAPEEVVLQGLTAARSRLEEISGARTTEDVLAHIFANFCIGK